MDLRSQQRGTGFTVGGGTPPPLLRRREVWLVFLLLIVAMLAASYAYEYMQMGGVPRRTPPEEQPLDLIEPMPLPDLKALAFAPAELSDRDQAHIERLVERPELVANNIFGPDPLALSWLEAQLAIDAERPPLYQRFNTDDIMRGTVAIGSPFIADGLLIDERELHGRVWAVVAFGPERYGLVTAGSLDDAVVIGEQVRLYGRLLGRLAVEDAYPLAVLGCRTILPRPPERELPTGIALPRIGVDTQVDADDSVFEEIDDIHPSLEIRPYYYLLGVVSRSDTYHVDPYAGAINAVGSSIQMHDDPSRFRGQPVVFRGYVLYSFEDQEVARDRPFGIERVLRIIAWNVAWGPLRMTVNGEEQVTMTWVRQAFEIAVIGDQPAPEPGSTIEATGRFLKVHGVPAKASRTADAINEVVRHSDNVYFKFIVANGYQDITSEVIDWTPLRIAFLIMVPVIVIWVVILHIADGRREAKRPELVRRLRATRRRLRDDASGDDKADPTDGPSPPV